MVKAYLISTKIFEQNDIYDKCLEHLDVSRKERINKIKNTKSKIESLAAGTLLAYSLNIENIDISNHQILKGENGKPHFIDLPNINFNLSHTDGYAMCVLSDNVIGCDIQKHVKYNINIAKRFFNKEEYQSILDEPNDGIRARLFYDYWTAKEAFIKETGAGLSMELNSFYVDIKKGQIIAPLDNKHYFINYKAIDTYSIAICSPINNLPAKLSFVDEKDLFEYIF